MFSKVIAFIMSLIMSVTGLASGSISSVFDTLMAAIYGVPITNEAVNAEFFGEIDDSDVVEINEETGFLKDKLVLFLDGELTFREKIVFFAECGGVLAGWCTPIDVYVIRYAADSYDDMLEKCEQLDAMPEVALAMPAFTSRVAPQATPDDPFRSDNDADMGAVDTEPTVIWNENEPEGNNWWLEAIDARQAWDYAEYYNPVKTGVLDAGFDTEHPELAGKISFPSSKAERRNFPDDHGTHVAGIIAAESNNGVGLAGICSHADLICVDWMPDLLQFWSTELAIFFGFYDIVKAGAKAINLSLGVSASCYNDKAGFIYDTLVPKAASLMMAALLDKGYDFLVVQAAGNGNYYGDPINVDQNGHFCGITEDNVYTGFYGVSDDDILNRIVRVASAGGYNGNNEYYISSFSNAGETIDIAAPGEDVYSSIYYYDYSLMSGTSMAAPVVTGVASLVLSVNPSLTGAQVKEILCTSYDSRVKSLDGFSYKYDLGEIDYPMVNAALSVEEALRRSRNDMGKIAGVIENPSDKLKVGDTEITVLPDGSFSYMAPAGDYTLTVTDSDGITVYETSVTVVAGETVTL